MAVIADSLVLGHLDLVRWAMDIRPDRLEDIVAASRTGLERALGPAARRVLWSGE
jgi:hypothetical protein